jgi:hypothetical protein
MRRSWWLLCPSFALLTARLAVERACGDPYDLLPAITANSRWAWPLALLYVLTHIWFVTVYLMTAAQARTLVPRIAVFREVWGRDFWKVVLMAAALLIEYAPIPLWQLAGKAFQCTP